MKIVATCSIRVDFSYTFLGLILSQALAAASSNFLPNSPGVSQKGAERNQARVAKSRQMM